MTKILLKILLLGLICETALSFRQDASLEEPSQNALHNQLAYNLNDPYGMKSFYDRSKYFNSLDETENEDPIEKRREIKNKLTVLRNTKKPDIYTVCIWTRDGAASPAGCTIENPQYLESAIENIIPEVMNKNKHSQTGNENYIFIVSEDNFESARKLKEYENAPKKVEHPKIDYHKPIVKENSYEKKPNNYIGSLKENLRSKNNYKQSQNYNSPEISRYLTKYLPVSKPREAPAKYKKPAMNLDVTRIKGTTSKYPPKRKLKYKKKLMNPMPIPYQYKGKKQLKKTVSRPLTTYYSKKQPKIRFHSDIFRKLAYYKPSYKVDSTDGANNENKKSNDDTEKLEQSEGDNKNSTEITHTNLSAYKDSSDNHNKKEPYSDLLYAYKKSHNDKYSPKYAYAKQYNDIYEDPADYAHAKEYHEIYEDPARYAYAKEYQDMYEDPAKYAYSKPYLEIYEEPAKYAYAKEYQDIYEDPAKYAYAKEYHEIYEDPAEYAYAKEYQNIYEDPAKYAYAKEYHDIYENPAKYEYAKEYQDLYEDPAKYEYAKEYQDLYEDPAKYAYAKEYNQIYEDPAKYAYAKPYSDIYEDPSRYAYAKPYSEIYEDPSRYSHAMPYLEVYDDPARYQYARPYSEIYEDPDSYTYAKEYNDIYENPAEYRHARPYNDMPEEPENYAYPKQYPSIHDAQARFPYAKPYSEIYDDPARYQYSKPDLYEDPNKSYAPNQYHPVSYYADQEKSYQNNHRAPSKSAQVEPYNKSNHVSIPPIAYEAPDSTKVDPFQKLFSHNSNFDTDSYEKYFNIDPSELESGTAGTDGYRTDNLAAKNNFRKSSSRVVKYI